VNTTAEELNPWLVLHKLSVSLLKDENIDKVWQLAQNLKNASVYRFCRRGD
jgi:hypothetical protein